MKVSITNHRKEYDMRDQIQPPGIVRPAAQQADYDGLIKWARATIANAYEEVADGIAAFSVLNPAMNVAQACRDARPDDWVGEWNADALRQRVMRTRTALQASNDAGSGSSHAPKVDPSNIRTARHAIKQDAGAVIEALDEDTKRDLLDTLTADAPFAKAAYSLLDPQYHIAEATEIVNNQILNGSTMSDFAATVEAHRDLTGALRSYAALNGIQIPAVGEAI